MAKINAGCLVDKRGWWYLVARGENGRQTWSALHTKDLEEARRRSANEVRAVVRTLATGHAPRRKVGKWMKGSRKALPDVADRLSPSGFFLCSLAT